MRRRRKLSSPLGILLAVLAALAGLLSHKNSKPPRALPLEHREPESVPAGTARVTRIVDGDTLHVLFPAQDASETVRLFGIDTPELHARPGVRRQDFKVEPGAQDACEFLASLCAPGSEVTVQPHGRDRYGRLLAVLILADGRDANKLLLQSGLARTYFLKTSRNNALRMHYEEAERHAQQARTGVWRAEVQIER